jgi:hypothetical protein
MITKKKRNTIKGRKINESSNISGWIWDTIK